jgi:hypothetical protein
LTFELDQLLIFLKELFHSDNLNRIGLLHFWYERLAHKHLFDGGFGLQLTLHVSLHLPFFLDFLLQLYECLVENLQRLNIFRQGCPLRHDFLQLRVLLFYRLDSLIVFGD